MFAILILTAILNFFGLPKRHQKHQGIKTLFRPYALIFTLEAKTSHTCEELGTS